LLGSTGVGKTYFAAAIARALVESGKTVIFRSAADYYADLRATFNTSDADMSEGAVLTRLTDVEFLVLDDVGAGSLSDHERRSTLHLLDRRINHLRPTIITSNLTVDEIGRAMDERIASRLNGFTAIALTGRDRRRRARE
jgi:DNA replication protein DnaC